MSPIRRKHDNYNFAARNVLEFDESDYAGTTRNATHVDYETMAGLTRAMVRAERPRTWAARTQH